MHIIASQKMFGYSVLDVREFMRVGSGFEWQLGYVARRFKIEQKAAAKLVKAMRRDGLIAKAGLKSNGRKYELTTKGFALGMARAAKPLRRATAERLVSEFLQRVEQVNNDRGFLRWIDEVVIFGSFLTNSTTLNDVDLAVKYTDRVGPDLWDDLADQRVDLALASGRKFRNIYEEILWPSREIELRIRKRIWALHIHDLSEEKRFIESIPHRQIYLRQPDVCPAGLDVIHLSPAGSKNAPRN